VESGRAKDIDETLKILLMAISRIRLTTQFPPALQPSQLENVQIAALNLYSSIMDYVSTAIQILRKSGLGEFFGSEC